MSPIIDFVRRRLSSSSVSDTHTEPEKQERSNIDQISRSGYLNEGIIKKIKIDWA
jgi:hypothetical protein